MTVRSTKNRRTLKKQRHAGVKTFDGSIVYKRVSGILLARLSHRLETSAVDNFTQLGFGQLLVVVLDNGLALV